MLPTQPLALCIQGIHDTHTHTTYTLHWTQMADGILKFMIGHLGLGSNVQLGLVDFKVL